MKNEPKLFGPETPGYAHLNEALRAGTIKRASKVKQPKAKQAKSQANATKPK